MKLNPTYMKWVAVTIAFIVLMVVLWKKGIFRNVFVSGVADSTNLTDSENATAKRLAVLLYEDMKGITFYRNVNAWREFMGLRDAVARQVYTVFGKLYYNDTKETLTDWVADEANWQDLQGIASREQVLAKLAGMGLTPSSALVRTVTSKQQIYQS